MFFTVRLSNKPFLTWSLATLTPLHLKCVDTIVIVNHDIFVCDCRSFFDINVLQGSKATRMSGVVGSLTLLGGLLYRKVLDNLPVKEF